MNTRQLITDDRKHMKVIPSQQSNIYGTRYLKTDIENLTIKCKQMKHYSMKMNHNMQKNQTA